MQRYCRSSYSTVADVIDIALLDTSNSPLPSPSITTSQYDSQPDYTEPARGRSISRGSSSSSLYERAVASGAVADPNRARSTSNSTAGHSVSPVASYSPPYTSSLNGLGAGTAVMQNEPSSRSGRSQATRPVGGSSSRIQTARPVSGGRRHAILQGESSDEDSSSEAGSSTEHEDDDEATMMDLQGDSASQAPKDSVSFARMGQQNNPSSTSQAMKQAHRTAYDEDDRNEILESVERDKEDEEGFEKRLASGAADVGRDEKSRKTGKNSNATTKQGQSSKTLAAQTQQPESSSSSSSHTKQPDGNSLQLDGLPEDGSARLFDSPHLPSSPQFTSAVNIPALANASSQIAAASISATLDEGGTTDKIPWADKPERPSAARKSLLRNLSDRGPPPSKRASTSMGRSASLGSRATPQDEDSDELSDPASNGYSYGFDLSDEDEGKGIVGRAMDLAGALWNVGRGMVWNKPETPPATPTEGKR